VLILRELGTHFSEVQILKELAIGDAGLVTGGRMKATSQGEVRLAIGVGAASRRQVQTDIGQRQMEGGASPHEAHGKAKPFEAQRKHGEWLHGIGELSIISMIY
jgi:hypothetical protein